MDYHRIGDRGNRVGSTRSAGILFTDGKSILLLKRAGDCRHSGTWAFPGGHGRAGETDISTAVRETKEETGLDTIPGHRIENFVSQDGHKKFTTFLYKVGQPFDCTLSDEHSDWSWTPFEDLRSRDLHPKVGENMGRFLKAIRRKVWTFEEWCRLTEIIVF